MAAGSIAFGAPEGSYVFVMDLNVHRGSGDPTAKPLPLPGSSSATSNSTALTTASPTPNGTTSSAAASLAQHTPSFIGGSSIGANVNSTGPAPIGTSTPTTQAPAIQIPVIPGVPANADAAGTLVAPPLYPSSLATVTINFPPAPPPNPFPHPGFLTGSKYGRAKEAPTDLPVSDPLSSEQTDSTTTTCEDPSSQPAGLPTSNFSSIAVTNSCPTTDTPPSSRVGPPPISSKARGLNFSSTLSSLSGKAANHSSPSHAGPNQVNTASQPSPRPRAAFKGSTSTFIKSSEGLPLPQSVVKTFYATPLDPATSSGRDEGEERTFAFYTWNKSVTWVQLSPGRASGEPLVRLTFQAFPTSVAANGSTASATALDVVVGFSTGDLIYFDPFCARYTRLNKGGCVSSSPVSKIVWLASTLGRREGCFASAHMDGTVIFWDKERDDYSGFVPEPWPKSTGVSRVMCDNPEKVRRLGTAYQKRPQSEDERGHDIVVTRLPTNLVAEKKNRVNPVCHWRISKKPITDLAFSPDLQLCAIVSQDGCLRIIDADSERLLDTYMSYFGALVCVCWSSDGRLVFTGGQDDLVTAYAPFEQRVIARCQGHSSFVTGLAYDPWCSEASSSRFASVSEDCKMIFWDLSGASLSRPRVQTHQYGSRRHSMNSTVSFSVQHRRRIGGDVTSQASLVQPDSGGEPRARAVHLAPGRNEVAILQPVMVKEVGIDPLSAINFHRDWVVTASRSGQVQVFGRPPTSLGRRNQI